MNFRKVLPISILALAAFLPDAGAAFNQRHSHATTLLPDGNILITGGVTDAANTTTNSVQMYNMATNAYVDWTSDASMARSSHTATLMSNGKVLIAGGFTTAGTPLNSLEICDPVTKSCAAIGSAMNQKRGGHTATLLSKGPNAGRVLICGGQSGNSATAITGDCDIFDPVTGLVLAPLSSRAMVSPRMGHSAVLLKSGQVFVTGGRQLNLAGTAWVYEPMNEMYDPATDLWTPVSALLQGRINHTATVLNNGIIMIAGGYNAKNATNCLTGTEEECWTPDDAKYWGYDITNQDIGSHGYLDGAEYFDQNGGRAVIGETSRGVAPYRVASHSAVLRPDGGWNMHGGYGGIVRTVFSASPILEPTTVFMMNKTGPNTADIDGSNINTVVRFPITTTLARAVSGRLVDADAFFSKPLADESVTLNGSKLYMTHSTATLDGLPVGTMIDPTKPGLFDSVIQLTNPAGQGVFDSVTLNSDSSSHPELTVVTSTLTFNSVFPQTSPTPNSPQDLTSGEIQGFIGITLPKIYRKIKGTATIHSGSITDPAKNWGITISGGSKGNVNYSGDPVSCDKTSCFFALVTTFSITGQISNLSPTTTIYSHLDARGGELTVSLSLDYTADEIDIGDTAPAFLYGRSDIVIRGMIFSSALGFTPKDNKWKDLNDTELSPTLFEPVFNHTALLTPAADTVILGGRNCENQPASECTNNTFTARAVSTVIIPIGAWQEGEKLNGPRAYHTSTMLLTGEILTCGGSDGLKPLATCELMDPATKKWTPAASMHSPRTRHTATLLPNGNVLVVGGATPSSAAVTTAEIYYPSSRSWVITTSMHEPRQNHTATLLPDGNVLVAGGATIDTYSVTTDIFISSTSEWQTAGSLGTPRAQHTATLLKSGNVLLAGGVNGYGAVPQSEVFNYVTRAVDHSLDAVMKTARYTHSATLLRDGRVLVIGGSNNEISQLTAEFYDGSQPPASAWSYTPLVLKYHRASHRALLLPNGKVLVTGGEIPGAAQKRAESFDSDFPSFSDQGATLTGRSNHTTVLTRDNYVINIGGWDGANYLDTTDITYFSYTPDMDGLTAATARQPAISTGTESFDWGGQATLQSDTTNFHGISEASGGGAGPMNSSQSNPRVYMQQIDNPSGFMLDLSTRIYSVYDAATPNTKWETTLSSITLDMPSVGGEMPHGWYNMRVAANGQFSEGHTVQVTMPHPTGTPSVPDGSIQGTSSIIWSWDKGSISTPADGYMLYAASNSVFIATSVFKNDNSKIFFTQSGLAPNSAASLMVSAYNLGGSGPLSRSATFYTLAAAPGALTISGASFETVTLQWDPSGNSPLTLYEVSMSPDNFLDPLAISTPVPFSVNYMSTSTVIQQLSANQLYYFRVRAQNGAGINTAFSPQTGGVWPSTMTVGAVNNLAGTAVSSSAISWSWDEVTGAGIFYELFDVTGGTKNAVYVGSTTSNYFTQNSLPANSSHTVLVDAAKFNTGLGTVRGPMSFSPSVFTLTVDPLAATPNVFTHVSTGSFTVNWITNGNPDNTFYSLIISSSSNFTAFSSFTTMGASVDFAPLSPNVRYYVRLTAINGAGKEGTAVDLGSKYTLARAPLTVVPISTTMSGITLGWDIGDNSPETIYEVRGTTENFNLSVTTYVPFSSLFTDNHVSLSGLLTATTYYFDVAARNGENHVTARIQAVPAGHTLAGPNGAPAGSVGGTSDPLLGALIAGTLPDGRAVEMGIPAGAFPTATAIAISTSATNSCSYLVAGKPIEVAVYSQGGAQPLAPISLTLYYNSAESAAAIDANRQKMVLARYNPRTTDCLPLETTIDTGRRSITATLNHFEMDGYNSAIYQLVVRTASTTLGNVLVYPNPFYTNHGDGFVTLANVPAGAKVRIYSLSAEKVWEGTAGTTGIIIWKGVNKSGELVASGIYLAVIDSSAGKKTLKLAVER